LRNGAKTATACHTRPVWVRAELSPVGGGSVKGKPAAGDDRRPVFDHPLN
jgi:hypothetical protein